MTQIKCTRCGLCCLQGPCLVGKEGDDVPGCLYLVKKNGRFTCYLLMSKKAKPSEIGMLRGCVLKKNKKMYENLKSFIRYEELIKHIDFEKRLEDLESGDKI